MNGKKIRIACIGDSNTDGWPGELNYIPYTHYLQELLGSDYEVMNFGKFNTTATFSMDDPYIKNKAYKNAIDSRPDIVTIMIGGNECKEYNWNSHGHDFIRDYTTLVENFQSLKTRPQLILCTPAPVSPDNFYKLSSEIMANKVAPSIRQIAKEKNLDLIDINNSITKMDDFSLFDKDKLHLNNKGHKFVADIFFNYLSKGFNFNCV